MPFGQGRFQMEIRYITTDLDFESIEDLSPIVEEFGERLLPSHNQWVDDKYLVVMAYPADYDTPEETVASYCGILEGLSESSKALWRGCHYRVLDIAFESGETPSRFYSQLPDSLISRLGALSISIAISIYPVGHYSYDPPEE
jgi:hypothetical protein